MLKFEQTDYKELKDNGLLKAEGNGRFTSYKSMTPLIKFIWIWIEPDKFK